MRLKDKRSTLSLLLATQFKMLASLQWQLSPIFAFITFQTQNNFLCSFRLTHKSASTATLTAECTYLLMKDRFSLTTVTTLLSVISSFSLQYQCLGWRIGGEGERGRKRT